MTHPNDPDCVGPGPGSYGLEGGNQVLDQSTPSVGPTPVSLPLPAGQYIGVLCTPNGPCTAGVKFGSGPGVTVSNPSHRVQVWEPTVIVSLPNPGDTRVGCPTTSPANGDCVRFTFGGFLDAQPEINDVACYFENENPNNVVCP